MIDSADNDPPPECDLILKGGVTSGIVFPRVVSTLAKTYRLRNIGGTSSGAIATAAAAAAEFRRQANAGDESGFHKINNIPDTIGPNLQSLFQPSEALKPMFNILVDQIGKKSKRKRFLILVVSAVKNYPLTVGLSLLFAIVCGIYAAKSGSVGAIICALLVLIFIPTAIFFNHVRIALFRHLPDNDFGMCKGLTTPDSSNPALTNWLSDTIDDIAGLSSRDTQLRQPLTVNDICAHNIEIACMTTDLSSQRPYQLPFKNEIHFFKLSEFRELFPTNVVDYLELKSKAKGRDTNGEEVLLLPSAGDIPVIVIARLSLSFPGLISAIPLYRADGPQKDNTKLKRCLFSDGGISSNFPIHFFDSLLPSRPTFGVALERYDSSNAFNGETSLRARLCDYKEDSSQLPVTPISGLLSFLAAILNTAKDWQDTLQSLLPGYSERIVSIALDPDKEGGLNLDMDRQTIVDLSRYGEDAGNILAKDFDFDEHRYRRAISTLPTLSESIIGLSNTFKSGNYADVLSGHNPIAYPNNDDWRENPLLKFANELSSLGVALQSDSSYTKFDSGNIPPVAGDLRIVASADS